MHYNPKKLATVAVIIFVLFCSSMALNTYLEQKSKISVVKKVLSLWKNKQYRAAKQYWTSLGGIKSEEKKLYNVSHYKIVKIMGGIVTARIKSTNFMGTPMNKEWEFMLCRPDKNSAWKICAMMDPKDR